jgi:hypothetical protein
MKSAALPTRVTAVDPAAAGDVADGVHRAGFDGAAADDEYVAADGT